MNVAIFLIVFAIVGVTNSYLTQGLMNFYQYLMDRGIVEYFYMDFTFRGNLQTYILVGEVIIFVVCYIAYRYYKANHS